MEGIGIERSTDLGKNSKNKIGDWTRNIGNWRVVKVFCYSTKQ
jgi:hypothetical protein